jgi:hypothetical protein
MKKLIVRLVVLLLVLVLLALVVSYFFIGSIIKKGVETVGPKITQTEVKLSSATLSLVSGSGTLKGFVLGNPAGFKTPSAIEVGSISVAIDPGSLLTDKIRVKEIDIQSPEITFEGGLKGNNLSKLLDNVQASSGGGGTGKGASSDSGASKKLQVDDLVVSGGKINLSVDVAVLGGRSASVPLPEIHLTGLGQGAEGITTAELTRKVLDEILKKAIPAAEKAATDALKDISKNPGDAVNKATKGLGDLLKKK